MLKIKRSTFICVVVYDGDTVKRTFNGGIYENRKSNRGYTGRKRVTS